MNSLSGCIRCLLQLGLAVAISVIVGFQFADADEPDVRAVVQTVHSVGMTVADMDRSVEFYSKVLSFEKLSEAEVWGSEYERLNGLFGLRSRIAHMRLGDESIELTEYLAPKGRPLPIDSRSNDHWFQHIAIITSDMERAYQWLRQNKVEHASTSPQRLPDWNKNAAGIEAFYFKDPDGHPLEILKFPSGKGGAGPGIEFLEYLSPRDGRRRPTDSKANDIMHWQMQLVINDADRTANLLRSARVPFVSPGAIATPHAELGFRKAILVRDPDGHAVQLAEPSAKD